MCDPWRCLNGAPILRIQSVLSYVAVREGSCSTECCRTSVCSADEAGHLSDWAHSRAGLFRSDGLDDFLRIEGNNGSCSNQS